jgi:hypothetical protein
VRNCAFCLHTRADARPSEIFCCMRLNTVKHSEMLGFIGLLRLQRNATQNPNFTCTGAAADERLHNSGGGLSLHVELTSFRVPKFMHALREILRWVIATTRMKSTMYKIVYNR